MNPGSPQCESQLKTGATPNPKMHKFGIQSKIGQVDRIKSFTKITKSHCSKIHTTKTTAATNRPMQKPHRLHQARSSGAVEANPKWIGEEKATFPFDSAVPRRMKWQNGDWTFVSLPPTTRDLKRPSINMFDSVFHNMLTSLLDWVHMEVTNPIPCTSQDISNQTVWVWPWLVWKTSNCTSESFQPLVLKIVHLQITLSFASV